MANHDSSCTCNVCNCDRAYGMFDGVDDIPYAVMDDSVGEVNDKQHALNILKQQELNSASSTKEGSKDLYTEAFSGAFGPPRRFGAPPRTDPHLAGWKYNWGEEQCTPYFRFAQTAALNAYTNPRSILTVRPSAPGMAPLLPPVPTTQVGIPPAGKLGEEKGSKLDAGKVPLELIDSYALTELAKVLQFGAKKYAPNNWRKGLEETRLLGAMLRHTAAYLNGEDNDPETGLSHIAHAMCEAMFVLWMHKFKPELDDRYKNDDL